MWIYRGGGGRVGGRECRDPSNTLPLWGEYQGLSVYIVQCLYYRVYKCHVCFVHIFMSLIFQQMFVSEVHFLLVSEVHFLLVSEVHFLFVQLMLFVCVCVG